VKIFLDTNVLLDFLTGREPFADDAEAVIELCTHDGNKGVLTTLSACTVIYVLSKIVGRRTAEIRLAQLLELLGLTGVAPDSVLATLTQEHSDFEDAVQLAEALKMNADVIVTRDKDGFTQSTIPILTPAAFLVRFA